MLHRAHSDAEKHVGFNRGAHAEKIVILRDQAEIN